MPESAPKHTAPDLICLSHLRWNFVFQRPQHLMTRCASDRRVFFVEEPVHEGNSPRLELQRAGGVIVVVPHLPLGSEDPGMLRALIDELIVQSKAVFEPSVQA